MITKNSQLKNRESTFQNILLCVDKTEKEYPFFISTASTRLDLTFIQGKALYLTLKKIFEDNGRKK